VFYRESFSDLEFTYVIVDAWQFDRSDRLKDASFERVPWFDARRVLEKIIRGEPRLFARLYEIVMGAYARGSGPILLEYIPNPDALVSRIFDDFGVDLPISAPGETDFARFYLLRKPHFERPVVMRQESAEGRRIGEALRRLGREPFFHRGDTYYLKRASSFDETALSDRDLYETLSEAQLFTVLRDLLADPGVAAAQRPAVEELLAAAEAQRAQGGTTELLLLRRQRLYVRRPEASDPAITPSQLRKALERHWIELAVADPEGRPVAGVSLELLLADGDIKALSTNADGFARLEPVKAGKVTIRLPKIDGSAWRAAGARPSGKVGPARKHVVQQGECLSKIALKYGFPDWELVWNHDKNAGLRKKRKSPHVLFPGDEVTIPGVNIHEIVRATDATHRIEVPKEPEVTLDLALEGIATEPLANHACVLRYEGPQGPVVIDDLQLDDKGHLQVTLPVRVRSVELEVVELEEILVLNLAELDPLSDDDDESALVLSGIEQRLCALGYAGKPRGVLDDVLREALAAFQKRELGRADATGEPDAETCSALEKAYGS
jgi:hypothetical protein